MRDAWIVEVQIRRPRHGGKTQRRARVLAGLQQPAKHELVDVRDFVVTIFQHAVGGGERRDVADGAQPQPMSLRRQRLDPIRIH